MGTEFSFGVNPMAFSRDGRRVDLARTSSAKAGFFLHGESCRHRGPLAHCSVAVRVLVALLACCLMERPHAAVAEVSDKDFEQAMARYLDTSTGRENIGKALETYVKEVQQKKIEDARKAQQDEIDKYIKDPIKLEIGKSPVKGPTNAKITIFEFSDFQCPYCKRGAETVEKLLKDYPNDVKLVFKNLPLSFHNNARSAAQAALAAGKQGKFWEFHDELFKNQQNLGEAFYLETAKKLKLDEATFKKDMASDEISKMIDEETALASKYAFQGTPGFVVGGVPVRGAYPPEHFKSIIDRLLGKPAQP